VMSQRTAAVVPLVAERRPMWWSLAHLGERLGLPVLPPGTHPDTTSDDDVLAPIIARSLDPQALAEAPSVVVAETAVFGWVTERILRDERWQLAPPALVAQLAELIAEPVDELVLTPRRLLGAMNSQFRSAEAHGGRAPDPQVLVNPADAGPAHIRDGDRITIAAAHGVTQGIAHVTADIAPGAVSMPHGWDSPDVNRLTTAAEHVDPLSGMVLYSGIPVTIALVGS
jgi:predicted molibdopterin-dependent oxidoreductase YjgC